MKKINKLLIMAVIAGFLTTECAIFKTPSVYIVSVTNTLKSRVVQVGLDIPRPGEPSKTSCATINEAVKLWTGAIIPGRKKEKDDKEKGEALMQSIVSKIERIPPQQTLTWTIPGKMKGKTLHLLVENVKQDSPPKQEPTDITMFCYELKIDDDIKIEIEILKDAIKLKDVKKILPDMVPKDAAQIPNRFYPRFDLLEPFKYSSEIK